MAHKFMVKVVPPKASATIYASKSYQKKTRKEQNLGLSDLPDELMEIILEGLSSADRIRFGATCKKYLSLVTTTTQPHTHQYQYQVRTIDKLPWMATLACFGICGRNWRFVFRLFEPLQQRRRPHYAGYEICYPKGQEGLGMRRQTHIKASKKGWFLCLWPKQESRMTCFLLFSPFNKRVVKLPDLDHNLNNEDDQWSCKATYSSDDPSSPDCVFFFLSQEENGGTPSEKYKISTLDQKSGKWNTKLFDKLINYVSSVVYHEGCFYCLSFIGELAAYDVVQETWNLIIAPSLLLHLPRPLPKLRLVACEGKLIIAFVDSSSANSECNNNVDVFRCGLFEFSSSTSTWVEKTSLGDHALFLGGPTSLTVSVPSGSDVADRMYFYSSRIDKACPIYYSFMDGRCHMSENGDYWSGVEGGMWIEPLPTF